MWDKLNSWIVCAPSEKNNSEQVHLLSVSQVAGPIVRSLKSTGNPFQQLGPHDPHEPQISMPTDQKLLNP